MVDNLKPSIVVLGAGVVGLSTALNIQKVIPGADVTIIADKFNTDTTSDGAAGSFRPTRAKTSGNQLRNWCECSFKWFDEIWRTSEAPMAGIFRAGGFVMGHFDQNLMPILSYNTRKLTTEELASLPGNIRDGYYIDTLMIECRRYLPWLTNKFLKNGGKVRVERIESLSQISGQFDVYVNCLGLGSREIFGDKEMYPVRGHLLRVHAPWVKNMYVTSDGMTYIFPGRDNVILGGTRQRDEYSLEAKQEVFDDILHRCSQILPGLKEAPVISKWIGLRPHRSTLRIEMEVLRIGKHTIKVIHNTGHGGDGVALSWGTAVSAAELVKQALENNTTQSKL